MPTDDNEKEFLGSIYDLWDDAVRPLLIKIPLVRLFFEQPPFGPRLGLEAAVFILCAVVWLVAKILTWHYSVTPAETALLMPTDFPDASALATKMQLHAEPVSQFLWDEFTAQAQQILTNSRSEE